LVGSSEAGSLRTTDLRAGKKTRASWGLDAALLDDGVEAGTYFGRKFVEFVALIDFNGLARGIEDDFAVTAASQVRLNIGACLGSDRFVDHIVEDRQKFSAGHFFNSAFPARQPVPLSA
jgi:hypothetical protein